MAKITGNAGELWLNTSGVAEAKVIELVAWELTLDAKTQEATSTDSAGWEELIAGNKGGKISFSGRWDTDEAKTVGAPPVITVGALVDFEGYVDKTTYPNIKWSATGVITSLGIGTDQGASAVLTYKGDITVTGAVTPPASH